MEKIVSFRGGGGDGNLLRSKNLIQTESKRPKTSKPAPFFLEGGFQHGFNRWFCEKNRRICPCPTLFFQTVELKKSIKSDVSIPFLTCMYSPPKKKKTSFGSYSWGFLKSSSHRSSKCSTGKIIPGIGYVVNGSASPICKPWSKRPFGSGVPQPKSLGGLINHGY